MVHEETKIPEDTEARKELLKPAFLALLATQFFTAFNDNFFRWLVVPIGQEPLGDTMALALGAILFTLPYLIFAPTAGFLADRFPKRKVIVGCKFAEIVVMLIGVIAIGYGNIYMLMFLVFCMGTQSALFSPAKMGAIPELLSVGSLSLGNGLMAMVTIVAVAMGQVAGYKVYQSSFGTDNVLDYLWPIAVGLLGIAVVGWLISLLVFTKPSADPNRKWNFDPIAELRPSIKQLFQDPPLARAAIGIAFFYFIALMFQVNIDAFGEHTLGLDKSGIGNLMPMLVIGIGVGSALAGWLSGGTIQLGMIPIGAMGIAFCSMVIGIIGWDIDITSSLSQQAGYVPTAIWLVLLGTIASLFYVPLETFLQHRSPEKIRGTILSASNALTNTFMLIAMGLFLLLREGFKFDPPTVFFVSGLITVPIVVSSFSYYGDRFGRFLMRSLCNLLYSVHLHGFDKIPEQGRVLLVPNHVSWIDGVLLNGFLPRQARFMIYTEYTKKWYTRWAASLYRVIPLSPQDGPKALIKSLKDARNSLQSEEAVCIFPEGMITRSGQLNPFNKGVMKIFQGTDAPVYPIYIHGLWGSKLSYRRGLMKSPWQWRRRVDVYVGEPRKDFENIGQVHRAVEELAAKSVQDRLSDEIVPARRFVRQSRSSLFRKKVADSSGAELTGGKLLAGTLAFQRVLKREVFSQDEKFVGVLLPPSVGGVIANAVLAISDKVSVNLNYTLTDEVINHCIEDAGVKRVLTSKRFIEKRPVNLNAELVFLEDLKEKITSADRLLAAMQAYLLPAFCIERKLKLHRQDCYAPMTIIYTSGSTGEPKGVVLTNHNISTNIWAVDYLLSLGKQDTLIGVLPFFHSFGYTISLWVVMAYPPMGVYHFNPLDARMIGKLIQRYRGSVILSTPTFLRNYLKRITPEQFKTIWLVVLGAEKLPQDVAQQSIDKFGVSPIEGYGTTELSPLVSVNVPDVVEDHAVLNYNRRGTVGQAIPGTLAKVVHPETHEELPLDTEGLLLISGVNVMLGYYNKPEKTEEAMIDGWYNTGDFAKLDADGYITITGRQSRFSKIGGEMVPHIRVEETLAAKLDQIDPVPDEQAEATPGSDVRLAVTSIPDPKKGERLVVFHRPMNCKPDELLNSLKDSGLPNLWLPSADSFVEVEDIPLLGTGKLDLKGLKTKALEHFGVEQG